MANIRTGRFRWPTPVIGTLLLGAAAVVSPARAQVAPAIDSLAYAFKAEHDLPGLIVGTTDVGGHRILSLGVASLDTGAPMDGRTRVEVGSVAKVFTALLLADMAVRGGVALDDPIASYMPGGTAPSYNGARIALHHLTTHTSGLPRLPGNLAPTNLADPYAGYTEAQLFTFLEEHELLRTPGAAYEYSNLAFGLLGTLLARHAGSSFPALLAERVIRPLGLAATYVPRPDTADADAARGYYADGSPAAYWNMGPLSGAGALRSTAEDLLRFVRAQLDPGQSGLGDAIRLTQRVREPVADGVDIALAWHVSPLPGGDTLYWHNGGTGGFRSFVGFVPERGQGVVVLTNAGVDLQQIDRFALEVIMAAIHAD